MSSPVPSAAQRLLDTVELTWPRFVERAAKHIAEAWRAALAVQFPGHNIEVTIASEPDEYGPTVSCHQIAR